MLLKLFFLSHFFFLFFVVYGMRGKECLKLDEIGLKDGNLIPSLSVAGELCLAISTPPPPPYP